MTGWTVKRPKPYTALGINRLRCIRCGARAMFQWQICSDGNQHRPLCLDCDVALNRMVLEWMGHPEAGLLADQYELSKRAAVEAGEMFAMSFLGDVADFNEEVLAEFGRPFDVHRATDAASPLASPVGSTLIYVYRDPKGHGNADWLAMIKEEEAQPGDYLVNGDEIYIYGRRSFLLPAQVMRCNHTIALLRAPVSAGVGVQGYGGACAADSTAALGTVVNGAVVDGWPASILIGGRQAAGTNLPMAVQNGGFEMMLPKTVPLAIRASDILLDNLGRRFIADTCELSELGWRMTVKEVHPLMADQTDVANALVALAGATIYPNGTAQPSAAGVPAKIYPGWPDPVQLEIDLSGQGGARTAHVSVFPSPTAKNTTRHLASWEQITAPAPTLQAAVAGQTITLAGTVTVPQAVALIIDGKDYVRAVVAGDTLATIAAALAAAVSADQPATAAGAVITVAGAERLIARIVANGTSGKEVAREERMFTITVWAGCFDDRDPLARLLEPVFANLDRLTMPDGSAATVRYGGSTQVDSQQKQGIYRRDITIYVDYALILLRTDTTVAIVQTHPQIVVDTTVTPLPIINT